MTDYFTRLTMRTPIGTTASGQKVYPTPALLSALNKFVEQTETSVNLQPTIEAAAEATSAKT